MNKLNIIYCAKLSLLLVYKLKKIECFKIFNLFLHKIKKDYILYQQQYN